MSYAYIVTVWFSCKTSQSAVFSITPSGDFFLNQQSHSRLGVFYLPKKENDMTNILEQYHERSRSQYAKRFGRVVTAMITPFTKEGAVDYKGAIDLANHLDDKGSDSLVIAGTTGESPTLSHTEQQELFWNIRKNTKLPIIAGTGSNSTAEAISLSKYVTKNSLADALLIVSPYYNKPPQEGIEQYYRDIAEQVPDMPIVMYDIPGRTGRGVHIDTIRRLAKSVPNIVGLKDAAGDPEATKLLIQDPDMPDDFVVYSGDDSLNLALASRGAVGAISVASHWVGERQQAMYSALDDDNFVDAERIHTQLSTSYAFESSDSTPNPLPTKTFLALEGRIRSDYARPPMQVGHATKLQLVQTAHALRREIAETE